MTSNASLLPGQAQPDAVEDVPFIGECHLCGRGSEAYLSGPFVSVVEGGYRFRYHQRCAERMEADNRIDERAGRAT